MSHIERVLIGDRQNFGGQVATALKNQRFDWSPSHRKVSAIAVANDSDIDACKVILSGEEVLLDVRHPLLSCEYRMGHKISFQPIYGFDSSKQPNAIFQQTDGNGQLALDVYFDDDPRWLPQERAPSRRFLTMDANQLGSINSTATRCFRHVTRGRSRHVLGFTGTASAGSLTVVVYGVYEWVDGSSQKRREVELLAPAAAASVIFDYEADGGWDAIEITIADGGGTPSGVEIFSEARDTVR